MQINDLVATGGCSGKIVYIDDKIVKVEGVYTDHDGSIVIGYEHWGVAYNRKDIEKCKIEYGQIDAVELVGNYYKIQYSNSETDPNEH